MDCDTTGIEPDIALVKYKLLAGGGMLKIVNRTVPQALQRPRLQPRTRSSRSSPTSRSTTPSRTSRRETARSVRSGLKPEHLPVFDCAFKAHRGKRSLHYHGPPPHDGRRPAVPQRRHLQDGQHAQRSHRRGHHATPTSQAWKLGLKCVAIYRDGSKRSAAAQHQARPARAATRPPTTRGRCSATHQGTRPANWPGCARKPANRMRRRLPDTRTAMTHKFDIAGHEGYITVGLFEDGQPGRAVHHHGQGRLAPSAA